MTSSLVNIFQIQGVRIFWQLFFSLQLYFVLHVYYFSIFVDPTPPGFGSICGGYGKKGKGQHIQRRIDSLTKSATYTFSLDVIIGDIWDGESLIIEVAPVVGGNPGTWETCYEERFAFKWNVYPTNDKPNHKTGRNICKYNTIIFLPLMSHIQIY